MGAKPRPPGLLVSAAVLLVSAGAQSADGQDVLPEVVVTARHISESLKDAPLAVSAFSADQLEIQGAQDLSALTAMAPSTSLFAGRGSNSTLSAYIRGIGQQDPTWGSEPGVGLYVDGVYYARPQAALLEIYDVSRIEELRGPQGTLYGRNAIGGAINYVSAPLAERPVFNGEARTGSYNERDLISSFSLPLDDKIRIGGAVASLNRDGWGRNLTTGAQIDNKALLAGRISVEFHPNDDLSFRLNADDLVDLSNANPGHKELAFAGFALLPNVYDSYAGESRRNFVSNRGLSLTGVWRLDPAWSLTSITAYREGRTNSNIDFDGLPQRYLDVPSRYDDRQTSEELRATYQSERLRGVAGLFFMDSRAGGEFDEELAALLVFPLSDFLKGSVRTDSWAGYGDASYDLSERWTLSAGARYSYDRKQANVYNAFFFGIPSPAFGGAAAAPFLVNTDYGKGKAWGAFTPRASLSFKLDPDASLYVSYAKGFRSGGFDIRGNAALYPQTVNGYNPEKIDSTEAGLKGDFLGRRLTVTFDGYYATYRDQQIPIQAATPAGVFSAVENAASSHIEGVELEASAKLAAGWTATLMGSYTFAAFDRFTLISGLPSSPALSGFQMTPKWSDSLLLTYRSSFADNSSLVAGASLAYRSFTQLYDTPSPIDQPGYLLLGANILWTAPDGHWGVSLLGSNLTDERYRIGGYNLPAAFYGNSVVGFYGAPRTLLASLSVHF
jgi:iron complex outermembrane receptor protein